LTINKVIIQNVNGMHYLLYIVIYYILTMDNG